MAKLTQALLGGLFFSFILDYFLFLGLKLNYIDTLGIELYFNTFFADNQNPLFFALLTITLGYLLIYTPKHIHFFVMVFIFGVTLSTLIPNIGREVGEYIFMKKSVTLHNKNFKFVGDIYYVGRDTITFYDKELEKTIQLKKEELTDETY